MATKQKPFPADTWIVMPGFNESKYVANVLKKVSRYTDNIIFIDDGSSDNTTEEAQSVIQHVLRHELNLGKGAALKTGCEYAFNFLNASAVILMDSDDQHNPAELEHFVSELSQPNTDIVFGAREMTPEMPILKRFFNSAASYFISFLFSAPLIPDIPSGYKAFTKKAYKRIQWDSLGYQVEMEIACKVSKYHLPFSAITIDTIYHDHDKGMTVLNTLDIIPRIVMWRITS